MAAALEFLGRQLGEPAFDEVEPGTRRRGEVHGETRVSGQPTFDHRGLVGGDVVHHQMHRQIRRHLLVDGDQEFPELDRTVPHVQPSDDLAGDDVQGRIQTRRTVPGVVVRGTLRCPRQHRQDRRRAVQCLDLGLLVHAQHHRPLRRREVEPDHVLDLVHEQRILGQLPRRTAMRLQTERVPDPGHRSLGQSGLRGHRPGRPVSGVGRGRLQRRGDHRLDLIVGDRARTPRTRLVQQSVQPVGHEPRAPLRHCRPLDSQLCRDLAVRATFGTSQHDPRPQCQRLCRLPTPRPALQRARLIVGEHQLGQFRVRHATEPYACTRTKDSGH